VASQLATVDPDVVVLKPLRRVSPSLGAALLACELSVAFRLDPRYDFLHTPTPASALGTISHDLAEEVASGRFDSVPEAEVAQALEDAWAAKLTLAEQELAESHPAGAVPPARRWTGYQQTRVRTLSLLEAEAHARHGGETLATASLALEVSLQPDGVPLHGRPDRVEMNGSEVELVDLKTGWTLPDELKPVHRRQLLAYAYLWHVVHGDWPQTASIQRLDGTRLSFEVEAAEAEAVAAELVRALDTFNGHVSTGRAPLSLASPTPANCQYCAYRPICGAFFNAVTPEWQWYRKSCLGSVTSVLADRDPTRVDLAVEAGNTGGSQVSLINVPRRLAPAPGAILAVVDAVPTRVVGDLRLAWDTTLCAWTRRSAA
jgi:PD-(D/E)XK nuclease superfamily